MYDGFYSTQIIPKLDRHFNIKKRALEICSELLLVPEVATLRQRARINKHDFYHASFMTNYYRQKVSKIIL